VGRDFQREQCSSLRSDALSFDVSPRLKLAVPVEGAGCTDDVKEPKSQHQFAGECIWVAQTPQREHSRTEILTSTGPIHYFHCELVEKQVVTASSDRRLAERCCNNAAHRRMLANQQTCIVVIAGSLLMDEARLEMDGMHCVNDLQNVSALTEGNRIPLHCLQFHKSPRKDTKIRPHKRYSPQWNDSTMQGED